MCHRLHEGQLWGCHRCVYLIHYSVHALWAEQACMMCHELLSARQSYICHAMHGVPNIYLNRRGSLCDAVPAGDPRLAPMQAGAWLGKPTQVSVCICLPTQHKLP